MWFTKCIPRWEIVLFYQWYGFTPILPSHALQASPIGPDHTWPCPISPPCHIPDCGQNIGWHTPLWPRGFGHLQRSHGHHMTIVQPCTTQATSSADLGPEGSNPLSLQSVTSRNTSVTLLTNFRILPGHTVTSICILRFPELRFCTRTWMHSQWCYSTHMSHCFQIFQITEDIYPKPYLLFIV